MAEYFDNRPFLESVPGSGNKVDKPSGNPILDFCLTAAAGIIIGCVIHYHFNKKKTSMIIKENDELKNSRK